MPLATLMAVLGGAALIMQIPVLGGAWEQVETSFTLCGEGSSRACVIDGDTIVIGQGRTIRKIRMADFNAPELNGECAAESIRARQARQALKDWLNAGPFVMSEGDNPPYDKYGRELRNLKRGDQWLVDNMLERKLGRSEWGDQGGGWCS